MKRAGVVALLILAAVPLFMAMAALPPQGSVQNPQNVHVVPRYLEEGPHEAGGPNIVTDIILNYRGVDTNGEVTVIFTALAAVLAVLAGVRVGGGTSRDSAKSGAPDEGIPPISLVCGFVVRVVAPFTALLGVFTILHGHTSPGGGFQGGTILGSLVIILSIVLGRERAYRLVPPSSRALLQAGGVLGFVLVGVVGAFTLGDYLAFPRPEEFHLIREVGLLALEAGIGIGGAAIVASLFWAMEEPR